MSGLDGPGEEAAQRGQVAVDAGGLAAGVFQGIAVPLNVERGHLDGQHRLAQLRLQPGEECGDVALYAAMVRALRSCARRCAMKSVR